MPDKQTIQQLNQHREWLGFLQPVGLVVSATALVNAGVIIDRARVVERQQQLQNFLNQQQEAPSQNSAESFANFVETLLEWMPDQDLLDPPADLEVVLADYGETLRPTYAVPQAPDEGDGWVMLVQCLEKGRALDSQSDEEPWHATPQEKFERLLRGTKIPIGLLWTETHLRLVYAPPGESSGYLTFPLSAMAEVAGRSILGALWVLLGSDRLFTAPTAYRLPRLLEASRHYQNEVSERLAEQVLDALWELLRGFQQADVEMAGHPLRHLGKTNPQHLYGGLVTTLMRLVFLLYSEERGVMPGDAVYQRHYSVLGLYSKLTQDVGNYPDTMEQRYGAWPWLLSLFRLVYDGGGATEDYLPARHGQLFDPEEYPFLEGRLFDSANSSPRLPRIPDGVVFRMLDKLLLLDGERISYRALDVEQIGSVYEAIMGYEIELAQGAAIALNPKDVVVDLEALLGLKGKERSKYLKDNADCNVTGKGLKALKTAQTVEEIVAALERRVSRRTPNTLPPGSLYLQPGEERRRSGSHYTPRRLTQPLVETTLRPIWQQLGPQPTAEQILDLKLCDFAMGSAAFLVEACRQLAQKLVNAWEIQGMPQDLPDAVEPLLYARRLVAQRCLYGVDKNPFAVNLAKLSLWLVTLAKDYPFTFVDHALKCGDSLVGLTQSEIGSFGQDVTQDLPLFKYLRQQVRRAKDYRAQIQGYDTRSDEDAETKSRQFQEAEAALQDAKLVGNVKLAAFFEGGSKTQQKQRYQEYGEAVRQWRSTPEMSLEESPVLQISRSLAEKSRPIQPFYWEVEFPEVFDRENPGFDAIVGNPPFAGKNTLINGNPEGYLDWLKTVHPESHGNSDVVAHFFRRAFTLVRKGGSFGLIATNTIAQGDTRNTGLRFICNHGGTIYNATRRYRWPGVAAVVVSIVHIFKG
ncbi:MAG: hypothetical protein JJU32_01325 [Phormidium sp. BM_Day4_Bin.17]|nr:hypothetical protein [Phormidium sp. BM_Day4_Bin.17]UCJ12426.1 MAG: hypothetical protein JWS08_00935 [Phormidium sp. PBR-2020]